MDITWRNTLVRQLPNNMHIIPNAKLSSSKVINYYQPERELSVRVDVGVDFNSDLDHVEQVTIDVATDVMKTVSGGVPDFDPFIRYNQFGEFRIGFTVILRAKEFVDQYPLKHEFIKRLHKRYREEGINIPFPIRTIYYHEKEARDQNGHDAIASEHASHELR